MRHSVISLTLFSASYIRGLNLAIRLLPQNDPYREYYEDQICAVVNYQVAEVNRNKEEKLSGKQSGSIYIFD